MRRFSRSKKSSPSRRSGAASKDGANVGATNLPTSSPPAAPIAAAPVQTVAAPSWFTWALAEPYETVRVKLDDPEDGPVEIHCLRFGASTSKRGLVMVHGGGANAHWYRFVAPFFAHEYDVVAITNSGNCDSSHRRSTYSAHKWSKEILDCMKHFGFLDGNRPKPYIVAHSMGTYVVTTMLAITSPECVESIGGVVLVDGAIRSAEMAEVVHNRLIEIRSNDPNVKPRPGWTINPPHVTPLQRFKLKPYQECDNTYILNFLAESSREIVEEDGSWCWKGDWNREAKLNWHIMPIFNDAHVRSYAEKIPVTFVHGDESILCDSAVAEYVHKSLGELVGVVGIPCAAHHVWLDQPLAFISAVRGIFAAWPNKGPISRSSQEEDFVRREAMLESRL